MEKIVENPVLVMFSQLKNYLAKETFELNCFTCNFMKLFQFKICLVYPRVYM